jgi:nicotinamide mononucleotide transporter
MELTNYIDILEWIAVITGILFVVFMITENIWTWFFGIISSAIFVFIMYHRQLYSESILYFIYILIGIYGWYKWHKQSESQLDISKAGLPSHLLIIGGGIALTIGLGTLMKHLMPDSFRPYCDAFSSVFGLLASYMEAHKWLYSWLYWIVVNLFTVWLYMSRDLDVSSTLMLVYLLMSVVGLVSWSKKYKASQNSIGTI